MLLPTRCRRAARHGRPVNPDRPAAATAHEVSSRRARARVRCGRRGRPREGDTALLDHGAHRGGEQAQSFQVSVDPAPQHPLVEMPAAAQCQFQWWARRGQMREGWQQQGHCRDRELPEERQGDVPVLDAVPPHAWVRLVRGAQRPRQLVLRLIGRGEGDEHTYRPRRELFARSGFHGLLGRIGHCRFPARGAAGPAYAAR